MRRFLPSVLVLLAACAAPAASPAPSAPVSEAERIVQMQVDAYNRHDIDGFVASYAPDAVLYDHPAEVQSRGTEAMRVSYGRMFTGAPALHVRIAERIVQGSFVIDHEVVTGVPGSDAPLTAVAIYEVRAGRIQNVWFIQ